MFRGVNRLNLDAKGRLAIPTRFRDRLRDCCASELVITVDTDHCLLIYPLPEWQEIERKLMNLPSFNKAARRLQRLLVGHATEVEMDAQGRVLLPPPLRDFAGLNKHAVLIGQGNKFELWDEERWNGQRDEWLEEADLESLELPADLETLSI
ncbi:division/cell wall cluster transcriptional repressor MraZ [Solemya velesiana gill symbiont]|uniref:Transcriptional regulator MraZ n=1 Tax=Solemya velesiana gill symbiont TaxID=1918948 RepID=A0A1T2KX26_9GAMM|nr:division/cell wall cluster transcriptional repressor MraZ [Solemya velesiana gill symbiont]OOZ37306.1 cell division/cell wall cluster transcriptional repressor MraZ [Solemya velesiana gill symbiont]